MPILPDFFPAHLQQTQEDRQQQAAHDAELHRLQELDLWTQEQARLLEEEMDEDAVRRWEDEEEGRFLMEGTAAFRGVFAGFAAW